MSRWTPEQEAAIEARGASLVVSAAAGSGKTSVLVERLIRLLSDSEHPCPAERMIVATFTNDAAGELRARLSRSLTERLLDAPDDPWLRRQQTMLQSASISTIHSFCIALLREQFAALDISASFRMMDDAEEKTLAGAAAAAVLEQLSADAEENPEIRAEQKLLFDAFCTADDRPLEALLRSVYTLTEQTPFGASLLTEAAEQYETGSMRQIAAEAIGAELDEIIRYYDKAVALCRELPAEKQFAVLWDEYTEAAGLKDVLSEGDFTRLSELIGAKRGSSLRPPGKKVDAAQWAKVKALRDRGKACRDALRSKWTAALRLSDSDFARHGAILRSLARLTAQFSETLFAMKQERNALGFGDVMTLTLSLLAEKRPDGSIRKTPLAGQLSQQYECIMIDEFQDADNLQDLIFRMLSRGGDAAHYGSNLFFVGDSKQCIYRFRNANPNNF